MDIRSSGNSSGKSRLEVLWKDEQRVFCRGWPMEGERSADSTLAVMPAQSSAEHLNRLAHEFALRDGLDSAWSMRPIGFVPEQGVLLLECDGERPLAEMIGDCMDVEPFLGLAIPMCEAVAGMHSRGLIHKDIKPTNFFVDPRTNRVKLAGFGIASRVPRMRQSAAPPEVVAGTLAYMAPEQTGRMNRSIDSRSDLYALGVTFYQMLTGVLPFAGSDPMEWIHSQIARQPVPPAHRDERIPGALSMIVMKLLAKSPEYRYQTATGLRADLERCLAQWITEKRIYSFALGEHDVSNELRFRERLYGRNEDLRRLHGALDRVVREGECEFVLVSGYSGVGKSSFVNELHAALVSVRGQFAGGKFDQYKQGIPYSTLAQAFQTLVRDLLCQGDAELQNWRNELLAALGANAQLMVDLVPDLALIIGEQRPVGDLSGPEAQNRVLLTLVHFLGVFARQEHPLVLFLDDLQWLDSATLDVLEDLCIRSHPKHLLLIGAYRENEVGPEHPLRRRLELIRKSATRIHEIVLTGIGREDVAHMIADAIGATSDRVQSLANIVFDKTDGNPFLTIQFVSALADEGLLQHESPAKWRWDLARIRARKVGDNVVELMTQRLSRFGEASLNVLQRLACLGSAARMEKLGDVIGASEQELQHALHEPLRSGLLLQIDATYAFAHDRIHEAAYALIPEQDRPHLHRAIGARLLAALNELELEERVFDVASQFNRANLDDADASMRVTAAALNLRAARKAKASAAYRAACSYLSEAGAQLDGAHRPTHHRLLFEIELLHAECRFLLGEFDEVQERIPPLHALARTNIDRASIYRLEIELHVVRSENEAAIAVSLEALQLFGIHLSAHPRWDQVEHEYARVWSVLGDRPPEAFEGLPTMHDEDMQAAMRILAEAWPPAYFTDFNLTALVICHMVDISLNFGTTNVSNQGYALFGWIMGPAFGRYDEGYRIAKLAFDIASKRDSLIDKARTCDTLGLTSSWTRPLSESIRWSRLAFRTGVESGDLYFACYSTAHASVHLIMRGQHLDQAARECDEYLAFARRIGFRDGADLLATSERTIASLRGLTRGLASFDDGKFEESRFELGLTATRMNVVAFWYWTRKTMLSFLAGDFPAALTASEQVRPGPWVRVIQVQHLDYHFYTALALATHVGPASNEANSRLREQLLEHYEQLKQWAEGTKSALFVEKQVLVAAEVARLDGDEVTAERLYEEAIRLANENGFLQTEGVACELAARFYLQRGLGRIARAYLRDARASFARWGAIAKVRQLDLMHPHLASAGGVDLGATSTVTTAVEQLDLATVLRVSHAVSSDMVLDKLIDTLMRTVMEHAGAQRAVLLLVEANQFRAVAEATTSLDMVSVRSNDSSTKALVPASIVNYVARSRESVVLDDARTDALFSSDEYVRERRARSLLCLPLANRTKLIGMLYLENNLASHVFNAGRITILKLIAFQAAISLENARLYADLEEREARIRRLVDSNIIGIFMWDLNGQIIDANDAFLRMLGFSREDVTARRLKWTDLTPPEGKRYDEEALVELQATGSVKPGEKELFRKDGTRVPILIGAAAFDSTLDQGVSFVIDLTEQKNAQRSVRESEQRYRELQSELAHANRIATMGQLSAWIAHDVRQPLVSVVNSAEAGLRWLSADPPDVTAALRSLGRVVRDGHRAAQVLDRTRSLIEKAPPRKEPVQLNTIISETLALVEDEAKRKRIDVELKLDDGVPPVHADRVQIQQVLLNLVVNAMESMTANDHRERHLSITSTRDAATGGSLVSVADTGPGVSRDIEERLFAAFFTTKPSGLGMGLKICRTIVESCGGRIWVTANLPQGAVFHVLFPAMSDLPE